MKPQRGYRLPAVLLTFAAMASPALAIDPVGRVELEKLTERVEANADLWVSGKDIDPSVPREMEYVEYDADSVRPLLRALAEPRKDPIDLYVANRLLEPLLRAQSSVIAQALPKVSGLLKRCEMREFQQWPDARYRAMQMPDADADMSEAERKARIEQAKELRKRKLASDMEVARHNEQAAKLIRAVGELMLYAGEVEHARQFVELLIRQEEKGHASFVALLEALKGEIPRMEKDLAIVYYDALKELGLDLRMARKEYVDYTDPHVNEMENSHYGRPLDDSGAPAGKPEWTYTGIELLRVVNLLAPKAGRPARVVPKKGQVDRHHKRKESGG